MDLHETVAVWNRAVASAEAIKKLENRALDNDSEVALMRAAMYALQYTCEKFSGNCTADDLHTSQRNMLLSAAAARATQEANSLMKEMSELHSKCQVLFDRALQERARIAEIEIKLVAFSSWCFWKRAAKRRVVMEISEQRQAAAAARQRALQEVEYLQCRISALYESMRGLLKDGDPFGVLPRKLEMFSGVEQDLRRYADKLAGL